MSSPIGEDPLALIRDVRDPTPLEAAPGLVDGRDILLKREDLGPNGAFKWRGALAACAALRDHGARGVVTSSTGNHGAATAWACRRIGMTADVVVPLGASPAKCQLVASHGATLHEVGTTLDEAAGAARELARELDLPFLEDGASGAQLAGTATIGTELLDADPTIEVVIVPLACGALAGGLGTALKAAPAPPFIIGVQSTVFPRLGMLWRGEPDPGVSSGESFAGGLADSRIVEPAFDACKQHLDEVVAVDDEALCEAIRTLHAECGIVVEGAAAAPLAALQRLSDRIPAGRTALIISGCNLDADLVEKILG